MTVTLDFAEYYADLLDHSQIENCVLTTLEYQGVSSDTDLSIMVDNDPRIQQLNQEFMGIDAPTDVLAFPAGHLDPDTGHVYLGDVIISLPQAKNQADQAGHSLAAEINLLVVHGVLHLLEYDHDEPDGKAEMWSAQTQILTTLGVRINSPELS
ncbi:MAG: rRNA maturation RNase YbeY [Anaerolineales bacterium]